MRFSMAGHILGAASVHVAWDGGSLLFSGDLGRDEDILMRPPEPPPAADYVVIESTYGDRSHDDEDPATGFAEVINRTAARGGVVVIPAFAVGRAQALQYLVAMLKQERRIPDLPVFLNSPMAADTTEIYHRHRSQHRLSVEQCRMMCSAAKVVNSVEESEKLNELRVPAIIISQAGWPPGAAWCTTSRRWRRTIATPSCSPGTRRGHPGRSAGGGRQADQDPWRLCPGASDRGQSRFHLRPCGPGGAAAMGGPASSRPQARLHHARRAGRRGQPAACHRGEAPVAMHRTGADAGRGTRMSATRFRE